uniref:Ribosomal protein L16 n=1 Tax=Ichthyophthirius multifiliis TaxID=5932 RepID=G1FLC8_ICHMU|nr:ribosomal protein L16 [Ichthyophthirius multifiliis]AEL89270.1 ribosomal protein L16 [Ichthyophthirius multifiliis]
MVFLRFNIGNKKNQIHFKKRNFKKYNKLTFIFGNSCIIVYKTCRFELNYFLIFKKIFKNLSKLKNSKISFKNYWIFLRFNYLITKKSKNSRMGKGKGSIFKWVSILHKNYKLIEFKNINYNRLNLISKLWSKKLSLPIYTISKLNR